MIVLVTGVSSSPGYKIAVKLLGRYQVVGTYNEHRVEIPSAELVRVDLTKNPAELIRNYKPDVLVHVAAIGNVDQCEEQPDLCYRVNVVASRELIANAYRVGAAIYYLSTDYVFDGERGLYTEDDVPRPINYYGSTTTLVSLTSLFVRGSLLVTTARLLNDLYLVRSTTGFPSSCSTGMLVRK